MSYETIEAVVEIVDANLIEDADLIEDAELIEDIEYQRSEGGDRRTPVEYASLSLA